MVLHNIPISSPNYCLIIFLISKNHSFNFSGYMCVCVYISISIYQASLVPHMAKNLPAMQETWVQSLGLEDPLDKEVATYSTILAWRTPWTEEPGGLQSMESQRVGYDWATNTFTLFFTVDIILPASYHWEKWLIMYYVLSTMPGTCKCYCY